MANTIVNRTLGTVVVATLAAIIWVMDHLIEEDLWEGANDDRRHC